MDRRKTLATVGAISLTASAAVVALGSSMGLFGLTDNSPRVGKLSPIDATQPARTETHTVYVDDPIPVPVPTAGTTGAGSGTGAESRSNATETHQDGSDDRLAAPQASPNTPPVATDHEAGDDSSHRDASELEDGANHETESPVAGHPADDDD